jgi:hypothetical protein
MTIILGLLGDIPDWSLLCFTVIFEENAMMLPSLPPDILYEP